jgi:hypothetical protein
MFPMEVNDNADNLIPRGAPRVFASKLAPTINRVTQYTRYKEGPTP